MDKLFYVFKTETETDYRGKATGKYRIVRYASTGGQLDEGTREELDDNLTMQQAGTLLNQYTQAEDERRNAAGIA